MPDAPPLIHACERISIVGCPGSGKSTLARQLAVAWKMKHVELDSIFHQANWTPLDPAEFQAALRDQAPEGGRWIACGNYGRSGGDDLRSRADCIIWLDLSMWTTMSRVIRRTFRRVFRRESLWNGNRERLPAILSPNPRTNIILYALVTWSSYRRRYRRCLTDGSWEHAHVLHLRSQNEVQQFADLALQVGGIQNATSPEGVA